MKNHRVSLSAVSLCFAVLFTVAPLYACAGKTGGNDVIMSVITETADEESKVIPTLLPDQDLNGFIMTMMRSDSFFIEDGVYSEKITGDVVDDSVYERNSRIEDKYNCKIALYEVPDQHPYTKMHTLVLAADDNVDMVLDGGQFIASSISDYINLYSLQYFNFDNPWWNSRFNGGISIGDGLYFTVGAYMLSAKQNLYGVIFNKEVAANYNLDINALYEAGYNGTWTLDMMYEYAAAIGSVDLNGDGQFTYTDLWGVFGEAYSGWTLSLGAGFQCAKKDSDDLPYITFGDKANLDVIDKMMRIIGDRNITLLAQQINDSDKWTIYSDQWSRKDCYLFLVGGLGDSFRSFEYEYGVLPAPKFSEEQEYYYHDASLGNSPTTAVPVTASDPDTVSFILEAMAYDSYYNVLPVFYDNYLNSKLARDEDSVEMLKIIHDTVYYDIGALYNWGNMRTIIEDISEKSENNFATQYAKYESPISKALDKTLAEIGG